MCDHELCDYCGRHVGDEDEDQTCSDCLRRLVVRLQASIDRLRGVLTEIGKAARAGLEEG